MRPSVSSFGAAQAPCPAFSLTPGRQACFAAYGAPIDRRHTVIARLVAQDPSAGMPSAVQRRLARAVARAMRVDKCRGKWTANLAMVVRRPGRAAPAPQR